MLIAYIYTLVLVSKISRSYGILDIYLLEMKELKLDPILCSFLFLKKNINL